MKKDKIEYKNLAEVVSIAYKKLKASVNFDKTQAFLRHKLATEESIEKDKEKHVQTVAEALEDLVFGSGKKWKDFSYDILDEIDVIAMPKTLKDDSTTIFLNKKSEKNKVEVEKWQYFIDLGIEGNIIGVIWTMFIGMALDKSEKMYEHAYANRLLKDLEHKNSPKLFEPYFTQYESWREQALSEAKRCLEANQDAIIITMDLERYYYSVDITKKDFNDMFEIFEKDVSDDKFKIKDNPNNLVYIFNEINWLVFDIIENYSKKFKEIGDPEFQNTNNTVLPIGFMPSNIISNWKLNEFDKAIVTRINPVYYGRYVDDILIVDKVEKISDLYVLSEEGKLDQNKIMEHYFINCCVDKKKECSQEKSILKRYEDYEENAQTKKLETAIKFSIQPNLLGGESNVKLQDKKVKVFYFKEKATSALIDCFKKEIAKNASSFNFMPDVDCLAYDNDFSEFFKLVNGDGVNKFRGIEKFEFDRFGASKALGKLLKVTSIVSDKKEIKLVKDVLNIFDAKLFIEQYSLWERIFEILIVNKQFDDFIDTVKIIKDVIDKKIKGCDSMLENPLTKNNIIWLTKYLKISIFRPLSLLGKEEMNKQLQEINKIFIDKEIDKDILINVKNLYAYRQARMINKYLLPINIEFIQDNSKNFNCLHDFNEAIKHVKKIDDLKNLSKTNKYLPYTVTPQEISFSLKCCELERKNEKELENIPIGKDEFGELVLKLYQQINNFSNGEEKFEKLFKPMSMQGGGNNVLIDITDDSKENACAQTLKIAIGNAKIDLNHIKGVLNGNGSLTYDRYQEVIKLINLAIQEKANILILPECYLPFKMIPMVTAFCVKNDIALVSGVEYYLSYNDGKSIGRNTYNLTTVILPYKWKDYTFANITFHHKCHYAPIEIDLIKGFNQKIVEGSGYELYRWKDVYFPVYCCYELASIKDRALFAEQLDLLIAVEWNKDINYYSNIIESLTRDLHCYCIQVNSSDYGDSRIVQPSSTETQNIIKTKGGINSTILVGEVNIKELRDFQQKSISKQKEDKTFKQTPPGYDHNSPYKRYKGEVQKVRIDKSNNT